MENEAISMATFIFESFAVIAVIAIIYKLLYRIAYLSSCQYAEATVTGSIKAHQSVDTDIDLEGDVSLPSTHVLQFLYLSIDINEDQYIEKKTPRPIPGNFKVGDKVTVTYHKDISEFQVDFKETSNKEIQALGIVALVLVGVDIAIRVLYYLYG